MSRHNEHGTTVVYADRFLPEDEKRRAQEAGQEARAISFLKRFTVFNLAQCEGLSSNVRDETTVFHWVAWSVVGRLGEFGLSLHPDKTRLIEFGRFGAVDRKRRGLGKPETFAFLGFTFICGKSRQGSFQLHRKTRRDRMRAKAEPAFRVYLLYDKICREDILRHAYALARANAGAPGVERMTFERIEAMGVEAWLAGLREDLVSKTYRPDPARRATIPKPGAGNARSASRRFGTGWFKPPPRLCSSRSSKRTSRTAPMAIVRAAVRSMRSRKRTG